jgi:hypothetical protein
MTGDMCGFASRFKELITAAGRASDLGTALVTSGVR